MIVRRDRLSSIDTALYNLEDPTNPMMVTVVLTFTAPVDFERLTAAFEVQLLSIRRFRQRIRRSHLGLRHPYWEDDPNFDLRNHLKQATLPPPGDQATLEEIVGVLASTQLDMRRSPWQAHLLEGYEDGCALVVRVHHSLADGMALMHIVLSMAETDPDAPWPLPEPAPEKGEWIHPLRWMWRQAREARQTCRRAGHLVREGFDLAFHPSRIIEYGQIGKAAGSDLARFVMFDPDPKTPLRGDLSDKKRASWTCCASLDDVKIIRRALGGTVNDVVVAVITGALRRYLHGRGEEAKGLNIRAVVPVNLRPVGRERQLGNRMGAVFLTLPVGMSRPIDRLYEVRRRMDIRKASLEGPVFYVLLHGVGMIPSRVAHFLVHAFGNRASAVVTNVKGPQQQFYLAGSPIDTILGWVPQTGPIGVGISILSYAGRIMIGVLTDAALVPDPGRIVSAFRDEFDVLLALAKAQEDGPTELVGDGATSDETPSMVSEETVGAVAVTVEQEVATAFAEEAPSETLEIEADSSIADRAHDMTAENPAERSDSAAQSEKSQEARDSDAEPVPQPARDQEPDPEARH
jgi:WS/DGAT/MGAT family acyltransferase